MRERSRPFFLSVLTLAFVLLVALSVAAAAQSGLPATVSMFPATAGPGDTVEVSGLDFPSDMTVVLELATPVGTTALMTVATSDDGSFRQRITFPEGAREGAWVLSARAANGAATSSHAFASGEPVAPAPVNDAGTTLEAAAAGGSTTTDKMVLVLIGLVLGAVATGALYAWRLVQEDSAQPGMGLGDDLIWSGSTGESSPEMTASDEPHWMHPEEGKAAEDEPEPAPASAQEVPTSA